MQCLTDTKCLETHAARMLQFDGVDIQLFYDISLMPQAFIPRIQKNHKRKVDEKRNKDSTSALGIFARPLYHTCWHVWMRHGFSKLVFLHVDKLEACYRFLGAAIYAFSLEMWPLTHSNSRYSCEVWIEVKHASSVEECISANTHRYQQRRL
jgi:hypothetical protein